MYLPGHFTVDPENLLLPHFRSIHKIPPSSPLQECLPIPPHIYLLVTTCKGSSLLGRGGGREVPICFHHPLPLLPPIVFWGPLIESTQPLLPFYMS